MVRVTVPIQGRSYDVVIGSGVLARSGKELPDLPSATRAFVVADAGVVGLAYEQLANGLREAGMEPTLLTVPSGEAAKDLQVYGTLLRQLASQEAHRDDLLVSLGGGSTGDLAGFVASTYMRGMPSIQVPTTLLAQVDAAIGGKNGVNLPEGKNLVGTFSQPRAVLADVDLLTTLADRDFRSGLAEVAKYGLALDADLLEMIERDPGSLAARRPDAMVEIVSRCVRLKADTVAVDERDDGARLVLNYGHTLGHALERLDAFGGRSHGEAVALGMVFAARLSERRGLAEEGLSARTLRLLNALGLEPQDPMPASADIVEAMRMDKKYRGGLRFVLLDAPGRAVVVDDVSAAEITDALEGMRAG